MSAHLRINLSCTEDIQEFAESVLCLETIPPIFLLLSNSTAVSVSTFETVLDVFKGRLSALNLNFVCDNVKPIADLPFYKQDRLLHYSIQIPTPLILIDELLHRLLPDALLDANFCEFVIGELCEREATFNQIVRMLHYLAIYGGYKEYPRLLMLKVYLAHFGIIKVLKQSNKYLLDSLQLCLNPTCNVSTLFSTLVSKLSSCSLSEKISLLLDVHRSIGSDPKQASLFDHEIANIMSGVNFECVDGIFEEIVSYNAPGHFHHCAVTLDNLKRAFFPDVHLAVQSALKHPFLYLNEVDSSDPFPAGRLYRLICEQTSKTPKLAALFAQAPSDQFYVAMKSLQLAGQICPGRLRGSIERLNPDDSLLLIDSIESEIYI